MSQLIDLDTYYTCTFTCVAGDDVHEEEEEREGADSQDSQFPNTQQLFGGDSSYVKASSVQLVGYTYTHTMYVKVRFLWQRHFHAHQCCRESESSDNKSGGGSPLAPVLSPGAPAADENGQSRTVEGLFGDTAELSSS